MINNIFPQSPTLPDIFRPKGSIICNVWWKMILFIVLKNLKAGLFSRKFACRCYKICTCQREEIHQAPGSWRWGNILHPCLNSAARPTQQRNCPRSKIKWNFEIELLAKKIGTLCLLTHTKHFLKLIGSYTRQSALVLHQLAKDNNGIS